MKYYCLFCQCTFDLSEKAELAFRQEDLEHEGEDKWDGDRLLCDICTNESQDVWMFRIPDYETPEQYKTRTGKQWPDHGPVWFKRDDEKEFPGGGFWGVCRYKTAKETRDKIIICVQGPNPPPDNWRP